MIRQINFGEPSTEGADNARAQAIPNSRAVYRDTSYRNRPADAACIVPRDI